MLFEYEVVCENENCDYMIKIKAENVIQATKMVEKMKCPMCGQKLIVVCPCCGTANLRLKKRLNEDGEEEEFVECELCGHSTIWGWF